ncbi:CorA metal ion transporter [Coemansia sp. RSA 552]|nr:CorA metal ion transporter [Coemansia sp. RSA 552]
MAYNLHHMDNSSQDTPPYDVLLPAPTSPIQDPARWQSTRLSSAVIPAISQPWDSARPLSASTPPQRLSQALLDSAEHCKRDTPGHYCADRYSVLSAGVRSSLVDTDSWYVQPRPRASLPRERRSRILQSIAATGRDSSLGTEAMTPSLYSATNSSIRLGKAGTIDIESATNNSSPVMATSSTGALHTAAAATAETIAVNLHTTVTPPATDGGGNSGHVRESSVLWMHNASSPTPAESLHVLRQGHAAQLADAGCAEKPGAGRRADRLLFYSARSGAVTAPSLSGLASRGIDLERAARDAQAADRPDQNTFWLDVGGATEADLHELGEILGLHPLTSEDIAQQCSRDKIDFFGDYVSIVFRTAATSRRRSKWRHYYSYCRANSSIRPAVDRKSHSAHYTPTGCMDAPDPDSNSSDDEGDGVGADQICIVMKRGFVLTVHGGQHEVVAGVLRRLEAIDAAAAADGLDKQASPDKDEADVSLAELAHYPAYIVYAVLDAITDRLGPEIAKMEQQVDAIDELVLILSHAEHESMLRQMGEQRRRILHTWQQAQRKPKVVAALARALSGSSSLEVGQDQSLLAAEVVQYLGDTHEHLLAAIDACSRAEAVLARSHSNYLAKISLELSRATSDSNATAERWAMLGTIVMPINILTSLLGVNLKIPGQDRDDTLNFFVVLACMLIYAGVTLVFWRWRRIV